PVESSTRGGYPTLDVMEDGRAVIGLHQILGSNPPETAVAIDFFPYIGAFLVHSAPSTGFENIWPRLQLDRNYDIRVISTENPASGVAGNPQRHNYIKAEYDDATYSMTWFEPWDEMTWTMTIAADHDYSEVSDKCALAWTYCREDGFAHPDSTYSQWNNDIWLLIDEDGENLNFNNALNLTNFLEPDLAYLPDTLLANRDTLRAYTDLNVFIDQDDWVHVTFTTRSYFALSQTSYWHASIIWHWTEQYTGWYDYFIVHDAFDDYDWNYIDCGAWNLKAQRPSLGQDPATGNLYCMYQVYDCDTTAISAGGYPSGEVYISVSEDGGLNWSVGTNITETITPSNAAPGECLSELTPSMAELVDDTCRIMYVLDRDAGFVVQGEGTWTLNDVMYHKVPVNLIPTTPLVPQDKLLHIIDSSAVRIDPERVTEFELNPPYPNPFNPSAIFEYSLMTKMDVTLKVYDIQGKLVSTLVDGPQMKGVHEATFDGSELASGIYLYRLHAGELTQSGKLLLLK
ncbi:MAG: T9SS type A sorting domain-containing protein, partial [bacterium]